MAKPGFLATPQAYALQFTLAGATLDAYLGGTTTATSFYSDKNLSTSLGSQLTADSEGRFSNFFLPGDIDIKLRLRHTATAVDISFDYAAVDDTGGASATFKNRLINGSFAINQRAAASNADDTYCFDRWYVLTQSNTIAVTALTDPEFEAPTGIRLTQSNASPQRIGIAQIVESLNCRDLRKEFFALAGRVRLSTTSTVRYAVLEWTGTADSVTSDVVNDWTSSTYTAGNFFISSNVNVLAVGSVSCTAATWRALDELSDACGAALNNLIVVIWTESTLAQNGTLDLNRVQLERGSEATDFEARPIGLELALCQRYHEVLGIGAAGGWATAAIAQVGARYAVTKRPTPTLALTTATPTIADPGIANRTGVASTISAQATSVYGFVVNIDGFSGATVSRPAILFDDYISASAEL